MNTSPYFLLVIGALAVASFSCRALGFFLMRYVTFTPRVSAAVQAVPLAVMLGILVPAAAAGGAAEWAGLALAALAMKITGNDLVAMLAGVAVVAFMRMQGG